jgi:hypothetical protein
MVLFELTDKIAKTFPHYKEDESFGGGKKFIMIQFIDDYYVIYYINPKLMESLNNYFSNECEMTYNKYIIKRHFIDEYSPDLLQYFNKLLNEKIIQLDCVYDIYSTLFNHQIMETKMNMVIENYDELYNSRLASQISKMQMKYDCRIKERIHQLFDCNIIINNDYYGIVCCQNDSYDVFEEMKNVNECDHIYIDYGFEEHRVALITKMDSKFYYSRVASS